MTYQEKQKIAEAKTKTTREYITDFKVLDLLEFYFESIHPDKNGDFFGELDIKELESIENLQEFFNERKTN